MQNAMLDETQAGINIAQWNTNNLRNADDTTLTTESEKELKSLLMNVKDESENLDLKLKIQKTKIMAFSPITAWQIDVETMETVTGFTFLCSKITEDGDFSHERKRRLLLGVFRLLGFLIVWEVCNPSFKVFSCNFTVWRSHHLFKSKFWCRACSFQFFLFYTQGSGCPITSSEQIPRVKMPD